MSHLDAGPRSPKGKKSIKGYFQTPPKTKRIHLDAGSSLKGMKSIKGFLQTPPKPKSKTASRNGGGMISKTPPSPSGVDASFTANSRSSSSQSQSTLPLSPSNSMKTDRILEYNLKPMATATATAAANDNVEAGGFGANSTCSASVGSADNGKYATGETIEIMTRGESGLTLISSPPGRPGPTPPSSPARGSKLDNKLERDGAGGGAGSEVKAEGDEGLTLSGESSGSGSGSKSGSVSPSKMSPSKMSPARALKNKVLSISGRKKGKSSSGGSGVKSVEDEGDKTRALDLKKKVLSISGRKKNKSDDEDNKVCFFSGQTIGKGGSYYFAANVLPDDGKGQKPSQLYTLSSSMKLMGYPTICDDDIRRMDKLYFAKTYRRLPEELRLSSNWTRVAKHCSFSGRPIPDGVPFFYARRKTVDENGRSILGRFCYLRADVVCANSTVEGQEEVNSNGDSRPLGPQDLMHLLAEYPEVCDSLPSNILEDPAEWSLIDKFCFFSGAPIKADDTYYRASLDGKDIYLLVVLSPAVTARELFQLETKRAQGRGIGRQLLEELRKELVPLNVKEVKGMDRVYDLSPADFDSLRERHYGSYQKLPRRLVDPSEWEKVVPPSFLAAKEEAMRRAVDYEKKRRTMRDSEQLDASPPVHNSMWDDFKHGVRTLTCGAPESFTLKELIQDDDSYFRELVQADSIIRGSRDDESIGTASLDNLKATLQRYSSRVGGQSVLSSDTRFAGEMFDEFSYADDATFYTYVTETTAGFGDQHNYKPDLG